MAKEYTPGPWEWDDNPWDDYDPKERAPWLVSTAGIGSAVISGEVKCSEANASLLAASPDLLEALLAAVDCGMVPSASASEGGASSYSRQVVVADMIRAAIKKATGAKP